MIGMVLDEVLEKNFKGTYELQLAKAEAQLSGEYDSQKEIDPNLGAQEKKADIINRNIRLIYFTSETSPHRSRHSATV
jgi:hypothetical protein